METRSPAKRVFTAALAISVVLCAGCALWRKQSVTYLRAIRLTSPGSPVRLDIVDPGLRVTDMRTGSDGAAYVYARNQAAALDVSAVLQAAPANLSDCSALYWSKVQEKAGVRLENVQQSTYNQFAIVAYTVAERDDQAIGQRNLIACAERDGQLAYLHVSKAAFQPADQLLLDALLSSVSLSDGTDGPALPRKFPVPGHGYLECDLPAAWRSWMQLSAPGHPPTISIAPPDGHHWEIEITVLSGTDAGGRLHTPADLHSLEEENRDFGLQAGRVPSTPVEDFATDGVVGSFYSAAQAGELGHVTAGVAKTANLVLIFTIRADSPEAPAFAAGLSAIHTARQVGPIESVRAQP